MPLFEIEVDRSELLRCVFPFDQDLQDDLQTHFGARWQPGTNTVPGAWVVAIEHETELVAAADLAGYDVEVI